MLTVRISNASWTQDLVTSLWRLQSNVVALHGSTDRRNAVVRRCRPCMAQDGMCSHFSLFVVVYSPYAYVVGKEGLVVRMRRSVAFLPAQLRWQACSNSRLCCSASRMAPETAELLDSATLYVLFCRAFFKSLFVLLPRYGADAGIARRT